MKFVNSNNITVEISDIICLKCTTSSNSPVVVINKDELTAFTPLINNEAEIVGILENSIYQQDNQPDVNVISNLN
jgi:hypothetical protein